MQANVTTTSTTPTTSPSTTTSATDSTVAVAGPSTAGNQLKRSSGPTVAPIIAGQECYIEILKEGLPLGINIVGGCDTPFVSTIYQ